MSHIRKHRIHYLIAVAVVMFASLATTLATSIKPVSAAAGTIYLSPATKSIQIGSSFTVALRITPGGTVDGVQATLGFSSSQLSLTSIDTSSSAFTTQLAQSQTTTTANVQRGALSGGVSTDALIANFTFKALVGTGTGSITLSADTNATSAGSYTNPSKAGETITFTSPACPSGYTGTYPNCVAPVCPTGYSGTYPNCVAPTCPSGYTGTYPNCTAPVSTTTHTCPSGYTGTYPNCVAPSTSTGSGSSTTSSGSAPASTTKTTTTTSSTASAVNTSPVTTETKATTAGAPSVNATVTTEYTTAAALITTDTPTTTHIVYGTTPSFGYQTPESTLATTHTVDLDSSLLNPGETYYYAVVATSASGKVTTTPTQTVATKGMTLNILVKDANGQPLRNQTVTLHSSPITAKTDANGNVTFTNVAPGSHSLIYTSGSKSYSKPLTVASVILTNAGKQATVGQTFNISFNVSQTSPAVIYAVIAGVVLLVLAAVTFGVLYFRHHATRLINTLVPQTDMIAGGVAANSFAPMEGLKHLVTHFTHKDAVVDTPPIPTFEPTLASPTSTTIAPPAEAKPEKEDEYKEFIPSNFVQPTPVNRPPTTFGQPSYPSSEKNPWQKQ